ncbi:transcriptional repressor [Priestia filamentosa]|nr:hypothetical protein B1B01_04295 [Priestia filamentosa]RJS67191.1 transcriptional repressor [Priestia filamentosa]
MMRKMNGELNFYKNKLKDKGVKLTPQRAAIIRHLLQTKLPITAERLFQNMAVKFPNVTKKTINTNLALLKDVSVVREIKEDAGQSRYEIITRQLYRYGISCIRCGITLDFSSKEEEMFAKCADMFAGFTPLNLSLTIEGLCADCEQHKVI